ncbi:MAG: cellulase family glycosylhydrolase [Bacteroidetes bacterium]|nr:cellulase family glycosylhydrolase [Bacteroidota bacterium]
MRIFLILMIISSLVYGEGFLKTDGKKIIDESGTEIILRGMGLGGWLLQEGYMIHTSSFANAEYQFRGKIEALIGTEKTNDFYKKYWDNYVREIDIEKLAEWGFNSIRLPMHYNKLTNLNNDDTYYEEGFARIDALLEWCKKNNLYLILDLHAAPGGQSDEGISDYNPSKPSLWESETNKQITIKLWRKLAERYKDEPYIGGYDLLNEPKWDLGPGNVPLRQLYIDITNAIREVDKKHIIFAEGNWYATDFGGLTPPWDNNMVYSFHRYWGGNNLDAINYLLTLRNNTNVPLWLGETGENSNNWFKDCVALMEENDIGWAWWPHKKIKNVTGPLSSPMSDNYQKLLDYWNGKISKPSEAFAYAALLEQAENLKFENCSFEPGVIDALFRQQYDQTSIPYKQNSIPGRIFAVDYNLGMRGVAYSDKDYENTTGSPGGQAWNNGGIYRNDGVDIEPCTDQLTNGFNVGWIESGEWLKYTVDVPETGYFNLSIRYAAGNSNGKIMLSMSGTSLSGLVSLPSTGGWQNWKTITIENIRVESGKKELMVQLYFGGFNLNYFQFTKQLVNVEDETLSPQKFNLNQNYPNPFNNQTIIHYQVPVKSLVKLNLYNGMGQLIKTLVNSTKESGNYSFTFNSENLSSGVYFISMRSEDFSSTIKTVLLN